ncbi:MAG: hypothetical protein KKB50_02490 [Planctomycetes bacterium]|nr:hypothetical protein [Planctomycetota bacterium]
MTTGLLAGVVGCAPRAELVLHQPFAATSQRELQLSSQCAFCDSEDSRRSCLLAFPLPGASDGPHDFLVYLDAPAAKGRIPIDATQPQSARGFLIQSVGRLAGKTVFSSGTIRCRKVWYAPRLYRFDLDVSCDDGSRITGTARVAPDEQPMRTFARTHAADIAALAPSSSQQTSPEPLTAPRSTDGQ